MTRMFRRASNLPALLAALSHLFGHYIPSLVQINACARLDTTRSSWCISPSRISFTRTCTMSWYVVCFTYAYLYDKIQDMKRKSLLVLSLLSLLALFLLLGNNRGVDKALLLKGGSFIEGLKIIHKK